MLASWKKLVEVGVLCLRRRPILLAEENISNTEFNNSMPKRWVN